MPRVPSNNDLPPRASLLGLPAELRLRIYEAAHDLDNLRVKLYGRDTGADCIAKSIHGALALQRTCRLIHREIMPVRPAISRLRFSFEDFDLEDLNLWFKHMDGMSVCKIRKIKIEVLGPCSRGGQVVDGNKRCGTDCGRISNSAQLWDTKELCRRQIIVDLDWVVSACQQNFAKCWQAKVCNGVFENGRLCSSGEGVHRFISLMRNRVPHAMFASSDKATPSQRTISGLVDHIIASASEAATFSQGNLRGLLETMMEAHLSEKSARRRMRCVKCDGLELVAQKRRGKAQPFLCDEGRCEGPKDPGRAECS